MIPKKIHYCWFGRNPKPALAEKCLKSWKKYCPDYEMIEWNEDNFDISSAPKYVQQAYESKMWAFVTDYVRLWAMTRYGGVYMDTDVELVGSIDPFLKNDAFSGFEDQKWVPTGIMACRQGFPFFEELLRYYETAEFINADGSQNTKSNVETITAACLNHGLQQDGSFQIVQGFALYPRDYFCPFDHGTRKLHKTENTVAIHWFSGSWYSEYQKKQQKKELWMYRIETAVRPVKNVIKGIIGEDRIRAIKGKITGKK